MPSNLFEINDFVDEKILHYLSKLSEDIKRGADDEEHERWDREDRVKNIMCYELLTVGFDDIKVKMDNGDVPRGILRYGSAEKTVKVGPVSDFIAPDEDTESMWCRNQKAIEIMEKYPDFDDFYDVWNGYLGTFVRNNKWDRTIVLREFSISSDYGVKNDSIAFPITTVITLDLFWLYTFYRRASERVEALKRIGELKNCYRAEFIAKRSYLS